MGGQRMDVSEDAGEMLFALKWIDWIVAGIVLAVAGAFFVYSGLNLVGEVLHFISGLLS